MKVIKLMVVVAMLLSVIGRVGASFHLWQISEVYSNADGTLQFIELTALAGGQQFVMGHTIPLDDRRHQLGDQGPGRCELRPPSGCRLAQQDDGPEYHLADGRVDGVQFGVPADDRRYQLGVVGSGSQ